MREFQNMQYGDEGLIKTSLDLLADKNTGVEKYREAFFTLGEELGKVLAMCYNKSDSSRTMIVCASEDADWLASGVEKGFGKGELKKAVYWNGRETVYESCSGVRIEVAPIEKSYEESIENCELLIVVKSIISTSCVVKTQLTRLLGKINPTHIAILAPVMFKDGIPNLKREFPKEISGKFRFFAFAIDDERNGDEVIPGIGGMVYPRLGLGDIKEKNAYIPSVILNRI